MSFSAIGDNAVHDYIIYDSQYSHYNWIKSIVIFTFCVILLCSRSWALCASRMSTLDTAIRTYFLRFVWFFIFFVVSACFWRTIIWIMSNLTAKITTSFISITIIVTFILTTVSISFLWTIRSKMSFLIANKAFKLFVLSTFFVWRLFLLRTFSGNMTWFFTREAYYAWILSWCFSSLFFWLLLWSTFLLRSIIFIWAISWCMSWFTTSITSYCSTSSSKICVCSVVLFSLIWFYHIICFLHFYSS